MILFFDTETTGKADFRSPPEAEHQPRLVQLAALLTDDVGKEVASINLIIGPKQFEIPEEAAAIHGITTDIARARGIPLAHALAVFGSLARVCNTYCCHNTDFDLFVMKGECSRMVVNLPNNKGIFCTMKAMTPICNLPGGRMGPKWPRLQEAYLHAFQKQFEDAHDALADVRACKDIYFWIKSRQHKPT